MDWFTETRRRLMLNQVLPDFSLYYTLRYNSFNNMLSYYAPYRDFSVSDRLRYYSGTGFMWGIHDIAIDVTNYNYLVIPHLVVLTGGGSGSGNYGYVRLTRGWNENYQDVYNAGWSKGTDITNVKIDLSNVTGIIYITIMTEDYIILDIYNPYLSNY